MTLHPDLVSLDAHFTALFQQWKSGAIQLEDVYSLLDSSVAVDGDGYEWGLTPERAWYRRNPVNGAVDENADPNMFQPAQIPTSAFSPSAPNPWDGGGAFIPADPDHGISSPQSLPMNDPFTFGTNPGTVKNRGGGIKGMLGNLTGVLDRLPGGRRWWLIGLAVVAIVAFALLSRSGSSTGNDTSTGLPTDTSSSSAPASQDPTAPLVPVQDKAGKKPSPDDQSIVASHVFSGDPALAASAVYKPGTEAQVVANTAQYQGLAEQAGSGTNQLIKSKLAKSKGAYIQTWTLTNANGDKVAVMRVVWTAKSGIWQLVSWPKILN